MAETTPMTSADINEVGARVAELLAESATGILPMPQVAAAIQSRWDGTVGTNRARVRRAIAQCEQLGLVELTTRTGRWDVRLPDGDSAVLAWVSRDPQPQLVFDRETGGYGSGQTTWVTTHTVIAAAVAHEKARRQEEIQQTRSQQIQRAQEQWERARERDPEYVELLRRLEKQVPGIELRVYCPDGGRNEGVGFFTGIELDARAGVAFKAFLSRALDAAEAGTVT